MRTPRFSAKGTQGTSGRPQRAALAVYPGSRGTKAQSRWLTLPRRPTIDAGGLLARVRGGGCAMAFAMSLLASVITFVFAGVVLVQYARRPRLYRLAWGLALVFYGIATSVQCATEALGWSTAAFRAWY